MPNLTNITIDNYQSLAHAELDAADLTVLVGPGRSGKSAVIRALCSLLLNENGDSFIRFNEKVASVQLTFSDNTIIAWRKERGKSATYELNGQTFTKTGTQVPEEIAAYLGIGEIDVEQGFSLTPQLKDQFSSVFILSESGSRQARILGKITKLDAVVTAQMACRREGERLKRDAAATEKELVRLREERSRLPDVEELEAQLAEVGELLSLVADARQVAAQLEELTAARNRCQKQLKIKVDGVGEKVEEARKLIAQAETLQTELTNLAGNSDRVQRREEELRRTEEINTAAQTEYAAACEEAAVCDACPFR